MLAVNKDDTKKMGLDGRLVPAVGTISAQREEAFLGADLANDASHTYAS